MRASDPKLKAAIGNVLNAIDSDLEIEGYNPSSEALDALDKLDKVIIDLDSIDDKTIKHTQNITHRPYTEFKDES